MLGVRVGAHLEVKVNFSFHDSQARGEIWWDPLVDGNMERVEIPLDYQTLLFFLSDGVRTVQDYVGHGTCLKQGRDRERF